MRNKYLGIILLAPLMVRAGASDAKLSYEKGLVLEEASGKLEEAIALFRKVAADASAGQGLQAQAQLHVGICYEKLARKEARAAYQTVVDKYPDQRETVRAAREHLARLTAAAKPPRGTTVREFARSTDPALLPKGVSSPADSESEFAATSDGSVFLYTDWNTGDLVAKNMVTGKVRGFYGVDWSRSTEFFEAPILSRDGKRVVSISYWYPIEKPTTTRLNVDGFAGGNRDILFEDDTSFIYPFDWSPDATRILVSLEAPDRSVSLAAISTKSRRLERLMTLNWEYPVRAEYSPDGRFIAYDSTKHGDRKIYIISADGLQERVAVDSSGEDDSPLWSPDGRFIVFRSNRSGDWDLYGLPIADGSPAGEAFLIKANIGDRTFLRSITADGRLFYGEKVSGGEIVLMDRSPNGLSSPRPLPAIGTRAVSNPTFAPDGKRLAYLAGFRYGAPSRRSLRIAELDGKILKQVPFGPEFSNLQTTSFLPDGRSVAQVATDRKKQRSILLFSAETGTLLRTLAMDPQSQVWLAGFSPDSRYLYATVHNRQSKAVHVERIDLETDARTTIPCRSRDHFPSVAVSPDGQFLLMPARTEVPQGEKWNAVVRRLADGAEKVVKERVAGRMLWDFDSRHVLCLNDGILYRVSVENGAEEVLLKNAGYLEAVSPDGKLLAFRKSGGDSRIWVVENFLPAKNVSTAAR
jgi:Tol biopolymer transport system component